MNTNKKEVGNLSSSSAFIIIIILVVVSVAAIIVGGGGGFSRKYAGIDFKDIAGQTLLAQTGVVGKNLRFEEFGAGYRIRLDSIELDGEVLGESQKYASAVVPPLEGDNPFWYRTSAGNKRTPQGYPLRQDYVQANALAQMSASDGDSLPEIPGIVDCSINPNSGNGFMVFFEDVAYQTGVGFDDAELGASRQDVICETLQEFEDMLRLDQDGLTPGIVVQSSTDSVPNHALSVVAPQYVGGSGFVSTLLADYLRTGERRSSTIFSDTVSILGINSGFVRYNFEDVDWSVDTGSDADYDLATVTRQNMLRLLGFGSFIGHEQENVLSSAWKRWTEWDRLLFSQEAGPLVESESLVFYNSSLNENDLGGSDNYDEVVVSGDGLSVWGDTLPDKDQLESFAYNLPEIKTFPSFQKGQSISGLADENAVSYPIIEAGDVKTVTQAEKEILCMLGLSVEGVAGCAAPRTVIQNTYIERENNQTVCVNLFDNVANAFTDNFQLAGGMNLPQSVLENPETFQMYTQPCPNDSYTFSTSAQKAQWDEEYATNTHINAVSFAWIPNNMISEDEGQREYVRFQYAVKDNISNRISDPGEITIHKCVVTANSNQLCNGDFQLSSARSPIDFQLSTLEAREGEVIGCASTTAPGWCGQGTPDVYSSEFGYTWHPYLLSNPEAFDTELASPRKYAGGNSETIIQRLRLPLEQGLTYSVTGKVYVQGSATPMFFAGSQDAVLQQPDGTYHINYPTVLGAFNENEIFRTAISAVPGEWVDFEVGLYVESADITHVGFGGVGETGTVFFDELSIQNYTGCGDCLTDLNSDCATNTADMIDFLAILNTSCPVGTVGCRGDLNVDGVINSIDFLTFLASLGTACPTEDDLEDIVDLETLALGPNFLVASEDDETVSSRDVTVELQFSEQEQVVPNAQGFRSNVRATITNNRNRAIDDVNIFNILPGSMVYNAHVATEENIAFDKFGNNTFIPRLGKGDSVDVYFNIDIESSVCSQVRRRATSQEYIKLIDTGLCDSYQELLEKQYGIRRDERGNIIMPARGGAKELPPPLEEDGGIGGNPGLVTECNDGIDNDGDGKIDEEDSDCDDENDDSEAGDPPEGVHQCNDGIDNDGDGFIDGDDPDCSRAPNNRES